MASHVIGDPVTDLSAVTTTGAGPAVDTRYNPATLWAITASAVTTGASVRIQASIDYFVVGAAAATWVDVSTNAIAANGTTLVTISNQYPAMRANIPTRTDGTYTVKHCLIEQG